MKIQALPIEPEQLTTTETATATWDPGSIADGDTATTTISVSGASLGDYTVSSFSLSLSGLNLTSYVSATDTVTVVLSNNTGGAIDLASGTLKVAIFDLEDIISKYNTLVTDVITPLLGELNRTIETTNFIEVVNNG